MLDTLRLHREWVALEALSLEGFNARELLTRFLPDTKAVLAKLSASFAPTEPAIAFTKSQHEFLRLVEQRKYLDLAPLGAYVPEGMDVSYLQYLAVLAPIVEHVAKVPGLLNAYSTHLALLLSNADHRRSTQTSAVPYKQLETARTELQQSLGKCFKNGSHTTDTRYDRVVDRNNDWTQIFAQMEQITSQINSVDRKHLQRATADTVHLVDKVLEMAHKTDLSDAQPGVVLELSDGAYQLACELESFAAVSYRVLTLANAIKETVASLTKTLKHR